MKVYLAGPEVFLADAVGAGALKKEICARHGLVGLYRSISSSTGSLLRKSRARSSQPTSR